MGKDIPKYVTLIIFVLVERKDRESVLGDLAERYSAKKFSAGEKSAKQWLWRDLATSMMPFLLAKIFKLMQVAIVFLKLLDLIHKKD